MNCSLEGMVVVIVGGAGLIGKEFSKTVIENNGICIVADINEESGIKVTDDLKKGLKNANIDFVKVDITSKDSIGSMTKFLVNKYGKIDALVNAAYPRNKNWGLKLEEISYDDFCENVNMHLGGCFLISQQFALFFKKQGYGNIINLASIYGVITPRFEIYKDAICKNKPMTVPIEYVAIKTSIIYLTRYMARYFKGFNIRFNCISPGGIFDNQPVEFLDKYNKYGLSKGMLNESDLKGTLLYLLSDMSKYVNGQNIIVDDGWVL